MKQDLINLLESVGAKFKGNSCTCPFHGDKSPSAGIYEKSGKWRFKCQVCDTVSGDYYDVKAHIEGKELREVLPNTEKPEKKVSFFTLDQIKNWKNLIEYYPYTNPKTNKCEMIISKFSDEVKGKTFKCFIPYGENWRFGVPKPRPLFNRKNIEHYDWVLIVEGEKCVKACFELGIPATTSSGGAKNAKESDWSFLKGKEAIIWRDNDQQGEEYQKQVIELLDGVCDKISTIDPQVANMTGKGDDIADFITSLRGMSTQEIKAEILAILDASTPVDHADEYLKHVERMKAGDFKSLLGPWPCLQKSKYLQAGAVTTVCGPAGSAKSWFALHLFNHLLSQGAQVYCQMFEEDKFYWVDRSIAQISGEQNYIDYDWCANPENHEQINDIKASFRPAISELVKRIECVQHDVSFEDVKKYLTKVFEAGAEFVLLDPVTAISSESKESWKEETKFVLFCNRIAKKYSGRIMLITHPKDGQKQFNMDSLAGSKAYNRFSQNLLWVNPVKPAHYHLKNDNGFEVEEKVNKFVIALKGRNNKMQNGNMSGFNFENLIFNEIGTMEKMDK